MKIVHLSDTHVGYGDNAARLDRIVDDIFSLGEPKDHVIVHTGDLIDTSTSQAMREGSALLDRLRNAGWRVLLCPGNHDYGNAARVDNTEARRFRDHFRAYIFGGQASEFPVLHVVDRCAFIGLDSSAAELGYLARWGAEGHLGQAQIAKLNAMLDRPDLQGLFRVLYLHHHPFIDAYAVKPDVGDRNGLRHWLTWATRRFRRLKDTHSLLQCIRDRVDVVLFGHKHFGQDYSFIAQSYGIAKALDASSSTGMQMDTDRMRYRILDTETGRIEVRFVHPAR
jgi:3',5'-cyclic AMP phosphodiesterase CpdA